MCARTRRQARNRRPPQLGRKNNGRERFHRGRRKSVRRRRGLLVLGPRPGSRPDFSNWWTRRLDLGTLPPMSKSSSAPMVATVKIISPFAVPENRRSPARGGFAAARCEPIHYCAWPHCCRATSRNQTRLRFKGKHPGQDAQGEREAPRRLGHEGSRCLHAMKLTSAHLPQDGARAEHSQRATDAASIRRRAYRASREAI